MFFGADKFVLDSIGMAPFAKMAIRLTAGTVMVAIYIVFVAVRNKELLPSGLLGRLKKN